MARPANALQSDAIPLLETARVLVDSAACSGDAARIARLPASCFIAANALVPSGKTWYFHPAAHWYRFALPAKDSPQTAWVMNVSTYVTEGEFDVVAPDGRVLQHEHFGSSVPVADRPLYAHELQLPLVVPHPRGALVVMQMTTPFEKPTILELQTRAALDEANRVAEHAESQPLAFLNGLAIAMAFFNLMLFVMLRRKLYLLYSLAIFALVFFQVVETGAAWTVLWPHLSLRDDWPAYFTWALYFVLIVAFSREFLELPRVSPLADRVLIATLAVLCAESALYVLVPDLLVSLRIFDVTDPIMTALMLVTMLGTGVVAWRAGVSAAPFYLLAFAGSTAGFVIADAGTYDLFPSTFTTSYILTSIGAAWESIVLALALGQRVRTIERNAARYEEYAYLDQLTGIPNRRSFDESIERQWRRTQRVPGPISVIIFDIDYFKAYNDRFGHAAGDARLVAVAQTISHASGRSGDVAARYGGEEFAMLLPGTPLEAAYALAESVRLAVRETIGGAERLTLSAGVATAYPHFDALDTANPSSLLKEADAALYVAKTSGRDRVCRPEDGIA